MHDLLQIVSHLAMVVLGLLNLTQEFQLSTLQLMDTLLCSDGLDRRSTFLAEQRHFLMLFLQLAFILRSLKPHVLVFLLYANPLLSSLSIHQSIGRGLSLPQYLRVFDVIRLLPLCDHPLHYRLLLLLTMQLFQISVLSVLCLLLFFYILLLP